jgi:hypothetical protein
VNLKALLELLLRRTVKLPLRADARGVGVLKTYNLESVGDDADSLDLLSVVAAVHHDGVGESVQLVLTQ